MLTSCRDNRVILIEFESNWTRIAHVKERYIHMGSCFFVSTESEHTHFFFVLSLAAMVTDIGKDFCLSLLKIRLQKGSQTATATPLKYLQSQTQHESSRDTHAFTD